MALGDCTVNSDQKEHEGTHLDPEPGLGLPSVPRPTGTEQPLPFQTCFASKHDRPCSLLSHPQKMSGKIQAKPCQELYKHKAALM